MLTIILGPGHDILDWLGPLQDPVLRSLLGDFTLPTEGYFSGKLPATDCR